jgi:rare lipoprotein A
MHFSRCKHTFVPLAFCLLLAACGTTGTTSSSGAAPGGGTYKVGQPYQVGGEWYYPREDYSYDETGVASWYGKEFHGQRTANGEMFNKNELTAAHKTLPLPTLARVTNLDNGRSIVVRINDRGPFSSGRIIDMSQRASQLLGFEGQGTAKVRVQVLADESKAIADAMRHYGRGSGTPVEVATTITSEQTASAEQPTEALQPVSDTPVAPPLATTPVQSETLDPVRTTPATHQQLLATEPVQEVVQLPVTGNNHLYIQAGAFTVSDNATRMQQSLAKFGNTSVSTIVINGTTFYRVRVGPVKDVAHADALLSKIKQSGASGARTVVD